MTEEKFKDKKDSLLTLGFGELLKIFKVNERMKMIMQDATSNHSSL